jgi:predicted O-methyltransferase YrrM
MEIQTNHLCPIWVGYLLVNPLRKLRQNPDTLLKPYVKAGMKVMDYGSAMGYFSLPMARITGENGRVYCVDIQEKMIANLEKRAVRAGLTDRIEARLIDRLDQLNDLCGEIDFALLFAVVHEVPDKKTLFEKIGQLVKQGGIILFAEPRGHVTKTEFAHSVAMAELEGFVENGDIRIAGSHAVVLKKSD